MNLKRLCAYKTATGLVMHNHPSIPLDSESTQMFNHLLAVSGHCEIGGGGCAVQREGQSGRKCHMGALQRVDPSLVRSDSNHMPHITLALTAHFILCTNEFIIREDVPLGGSAQSRVTAQISHRYLCSRYLRSNSLRPERAGSSTELHKWAVFQGSTRTRARAAIPPTCSQKHENQLKCASVDGWY